MADTKAEANASGGGDGGGGGGALKNIRDSENKIRVSDRNLETSMFELQQSGVEGPS
jgi:hypothetical protein